MGTIDRNIIDSYAGLFEGLNSVAKIELIEKLLKSLKKNDIPKEDNFFKSFGAFSSDKSAEDIISEIKDNRKFRNKDIEL